MTHKTILLRGQIGATDPINETTLRKVLEQCDGPVRVIISSNGGDVCETIACYHQLTAHAREKGDVVTVARRAQSGGSILFCAGDIRSIEPEGEIMIHHPSGGTDATQVAARDWIMEIYAERTTQPSEILAQLMSKKDVAYDAHAALQYNLAHLVLPHPVRDWEIDHVVG